MLSLSNIHTLILGVLLLFTQAKSFVESSPSSYPNDTITSCIARERSALVRFKAGLSDPANLLSSWKGHSRKKKWKGHDCCKWKGVHCSIRNNHVVKLNLMGQSYYYYDDGHVLGGNISSSLLGLQHLQYLNLGGNRFHGVQIPEFLGSLHKLRYMDLSSSGFIGRIPPQLGNLSNLRYLDLASDSVTYSTDITWLTQLTYLEQLDMSNVNLSRVVHWVPVVNMLPYLKVLFLDNCSLRTSSGLLELSNLTSLETLYLPENSFNTRITHNWFWGLTSLTDLDISFSGFYGQFPDEIGNMTTIVRLGLSGNNLVGMIPSNLKNLCSLEELYSLRF